MRLIPWHFYHKTDKTIKTSLCVWGKLPTGGFPTATRLRSRPTFTNGFARFASFVTLFV